MADTAKRLVGPTQLTASAATVYTVPASTTALLRHMRVVNTGTVAATITVSIGADAAGTRIWAGQTVQPGGFLDWSGLMVMAAAETLQAYASAASTLTLTISGVEAS